VIATEAPQLLAAAQLDPLGVDYLLRRQPPYTMQYGRVEPYRTPLEGLGQAAISGQLATDSIEQTWARLRDADFMTSVMERYGAHPIETIEGLEPAFVLMAARLGLNIRRAPTAAYVGAHPLDFDRKRLFTGYFGPESVFIESLHSSYFAVDAALPVVGDVRFAEGDQHELVTQLSGAIQTAHAAYASMYDSMLAVKTGVPPDLFADYIAPNFPTLTIQGEAYKAPSGAEFPTMPLDNMVWGLDCETPGGRYHDFVAKQRPYLTPAQARIMMEFATANGQSLAGFILDGTTPLSANERQKLRGELIAALKTNQQWRGLHYKVAKESFESRPQGALGSGGGNPAMLMEIIEDLRAQVTGIKNGRHSQAVSGQSAADPGSGHGAR
jgi:monodechloroaminopyrrolnitrin synthase PrnB-like protein